MSEQHNNSTVSFDMRTMAIPSTPPGSPTRAVALRVPNTPPRINRRYVYRAPPQSFADIEIPPWNLDGTTTY